MSLRGRLTLVAAAAVAASIALVAGVVFYAENRELRLLVDADLRSQAAAIAEELLVSGEVEAAARESPLLAVFSAQVVSPQGEVVPLAQGQQLPVDERVEAVADGQGDRFYATVDVDGRLLRTLTIPLDAGALQVARSIEELDRHLLHVGGLLTLVSFGGIGIAVLLGQLVSGAGLRPLARLTRSAEQVAATRDLRQRIEVRSSDELGRLGAALNTMLEALHASLGRQRQLVADASHELRTPLSSLRTNLEVLERADELPDDERERLMTDVRAELEGLIRAVDDLLDLARDEPSPGEREDVALDRLVADAVSWARRRIPEIRFDIHLAATTVRAESAQVRRAVANLLDNAAKWSPRDRPVEVTLTGDELTVRDHGPGIEPDDLPKVFERFYRAPAARGRPGAGLGLAIVRKVADAHGWQVSAENAASGGASLRIRFRPDSSPLLRSSSGAVQPSSAVSRPTADEQHSTKRRAHGRLGPRRAAVLTMAAAMASVPLLAVLGASGLAGAPPRLATMNSTLERCGDRFCMAGTIVDFGPDWYLTEAEAAHDFDRDGQLSNVADELDGLVGTAVTVETDDGPIDADVFTIDGLPYRSLDGELPPPRRASRTATTGSHRTAGVATRQTQVSGRLERCGDDYCVGDITADLGPHWYLARTISERDYDQDGHRGLLVHELAGLLGTAVVLYGGGGADDVVVSRINGLAYRDIRAPPPWEGGPLRPRAGAAGGD